MTKPEAAPGEDEIERVQSFVPGLDDVLCGGFLRGGLYMIQGPPGAGKTILASQIIYSRVSKESRALFVTILGENHGRMMAHLRPMHFFDPSAVPDQVAYINAYTALKEKGLEGLAVFFRREILAHGATLLVVDGFSLVKAKAEIPFEMERFTHELQILASATSCTMFLLTTTPSATFAPESMMVDGFIELQQRLYGSRNERRLVVHKLRGSAYLEGEHAFRITRNGFTVYPRAEAIFANSSQRDVWSHTRMSSGVPALDAMLGGGIPTATMTALVGPLGGGKTTLGLQFLAGSNAAEPGLLFGCYETPERLRFKAGEMNLDFAAAEQRGDLEVLWHPVGEHILDELAHRLLGAIHRRGVKRLVIDGTSGFQQASLEPERLVRFWAALSNELRARGVTTLYTSEMPELIGSDVRVPVSGIPSLSEVMILLRYVELRSRLYRLISLFKVREGAFDPTIREFKITDAGIVIGQPFAGVEAVLSGMAREAATRDRLVAVSEGNNAAPPADNTVPPG